MFIRRLPDRMLQCWGTLKKPEELPNFGSFRSDLIPDLWSHCFTVEVLKDNTAVNNYIYSYVGAEIVNAFGSNIQGARVNINIKGIPGEKIVAKFDGVLKSCEPLVEEGVFMNKKHQTIKYRTCILPFGQDNVVTNLVVGLAWQVTG